MLKILHIIPSLAKGGAQRLVLDICNELNNRNNVNVTLLTFSDINEFSFLSQKINHIVCPSKVLPSLTGKLLVELSEYQKIIDDIKPDIIHSHLYEAEIVSRWQTSPNIKYITHCHDNMPQFLKFSLKTLLDKHKLTNYIERYLILKRYSQCSNNFIAISEDTFNYFNKYLPSSLSKIKLLHNAIDFKFFYKVNKKKYSNTLTLVNTGNLIQKKNQIFLIEVIKVLKLKGTNVILHILGDGQDKGKLLTSIKSEGLEKNIIIHGAVENVEYFLSKSDIYVHSALYEPFGLVLLEAMAAGLPIVSLDGGGNRDILKNGENGFIVLKNNPVLFAEKILEIALNADLYKRMSAFSVNFARKYDIKEYIDELILYYNSILKEKSPSL